jgi:hypothetical protein
VVGYYVSFYVGTASGGTIVLVATALFLVVFVASPSHGVIAHRRRQHPQHAAVEAAVDQRNPDQRAPDQRGADQMDEQLERP